MQWLLSSVDCYYPEGVERVHCDPAMQACLFDLVLDPCETTNLASVFPEKVALLTRLLEQQNSSYIAPLTQKVDSAADPSLHGGVWVPWKD